MQRVALSAEKVPAGHASHKLCPSFPEYVPASHTRQKKPDCTDPAGQAWHGPFSARTVPAGHVWQKKASDRLL